MNNSNERNFKNIITENFLLALLPVLAYGMAYCFELGYLLAFDLPQILITVTFERFFSAVLILITFLVWVVGFGDGISKFFPIKNWGTFFPLFGYGAVLLFIVYNLFHTENKLLHGALLFCLLMYLLLLYGGPYFVSKAKNASYAETYWRLNSLSSESQKDHLMNVLYRKFGDIFLYTTFFMILVPITVGVGFASAKGKSRYLVMNDEGESYALIRSYSDLFIYVGIERNWLSLDKFDYRFSGQSFLLDTHPSKRIYRKEFVTRE